ncbi:transcription antitermination factor NusB, partial [Candidatus Gottesmanbacteria bacterium]|nr:transcription antitermination factor NusB [Candidatus Gottesmanbacteria bacterium]
MKTALDPRHQKRQNAIQELFAWAFKKQKVETDLAKEVIKNLEIIDKTVTENAPEFPLDRINGVDLAVLRLAIYELMIVRAEPVKVIIDEAVELAKEFGGETSPSFINGVLAKVLVSPARIRKVIADSLGVEEEKIIPEA